jgi:predicted secreted protein
MRKILLASAAVLGASGSLAIAQNAPNPMQGQYNAPLLGGPAAQTNLNTFGTAHPGASLAPQPGTVVIRLNGKVYAEMDLSYYSGMTSNIGTIAAANAVGAAGNTATYKLNPVGAASYVRLYPGIDGMATNGLRYGAAVEIRQNFEGGNTFSVSTTAAGVATTPSQTATSGTNSSASGVSSAQTLFTRRAFVYMGTDQLGIIRLGQQDGLIGIYDATGIHTVGSWDGGIGNILNSGFQAVTPNQYLISWGWLSGNGVEYGDNKIVYLSPSFYGVDFGLEFGPNQGNSFSESSTSSPYQVGPCATASANCINVTSGTDASRWINRFGVGVRAIETFGGAVIDAYGDYTVSGTAKNNTAAAVAINATPYGSAARVAAGAGSLKYDGQNFFNGGIAVTFAGFTVNGDFTVGRLNGSNALDPTGGVPMHAELVGASYAFGQFSVGAVVGIVDSQGSANLVGISQRHETALAVGGAYRIAPGINLCLEYQYLQKHQGDFNFNTNVAGAPAVGAAPGIGGAGGAGNDIHGQGLTFATIVNW